MTTGEKLQALRKQKEYTQEDLAEIIGVSRQTIYKWESDSAYPETEKLIVLARLFKCSIEYLLMDEVQQVDGGDNKLATYSSASKQRNMPVTIFSIVTVSLCAILMGLLFTPARNDASYYKLVFSGFNPYYSIPGILNIVCIVANLGLGIANICIYKKELFKTNKILNIVIFHLTSSVLLIGNIKSIGPCFIVICFLLTGLVVCQRAIKIFRFGDENPTLTTKKINIFKVCILHVCGLLLFLIFGDYRNVIVFGNDIITNVYCFKDWATKIFYFEFLAIIFRILIFCAFVLTGTMILYSNNVLSRIQRISNIVMLAFVGSFKITLQFVCGAKFQSDSWIFKILFYLYIVIVCIQYIFRKKHLGAHGG